MGGDIAGASFAWSASCILKSFAELTWVSVLQPGASYIRILLIDDVLDVFRVLLDVIRHLNTGQTGSDSQNLDLPGRRVLVAS